MAKKINYDFLECVRKMPPLIHNPKTEEFDIGKSEVAKWIVSQPEVLQKIFDLASSHGVIRYNRKAGVWMGVEYNGD